MSAFVSEILTDAASGVGRYKNLDGATRELAQRLLYEVGKDPLSLSGTAVGVDLLNEMLLVSPWR